MLELSFADQEPNSLSNAKDFLGLFVMSGAWDTQKFLKILSEIRSYSLIDFDDQEKMCSIHPLVHDWILDTISCGKVTCASALCILGMSFSWKFVSEDYSFRQTLLPQIDVALQCVTSIGPFLGARLVHIYGEGGRWKETEELQVLVVEMTKQVHGSQMDVTHWCSGNPQFYSVCITCSKRETHLVQW